MLPVIWLAIFGDDLLPAPFSVAYSGHSYRPASCVAISAVFLLLPAERIKRSASPAANLSNRAKLPPNVWRISLPASAHNSKSPSRSARCCRTDILFNLAFIASPLLTQMQLHTPIHW